MPVGSEAGSLEVLIPDAGFKGTVVLLLFFFLFFFFFFFFVSTADPSSRSASAPDSLWKYPASMAFKFSACSGLDADQRFIYSFTPSPSWSFVAGVKDTDLRLDSLASVGGEVEDSSGCGKLAGFVVASFSDVLDLDLDFLGFLVIGVSIGISGGSFLFFSLATVEGEPFGIADGESSSFAYLSLNPSFFQAGMCFSTA